MNYRIFKGDQIAAIGLGTWQLGSADWGQIDEANALDILNTYVEAGGNFIDTADVYGMGTSERLIGKFLKQTDKKVYVATKLGRRDDAPNGWPQNFSYDAIRRHVEDSLTHLGLDQLYLEQLHCIPTEVLRKGEVFDHLRRIQEEGLIQHFGVSVETVEEALICLEHQDVAALQIIFNLFRQHLADDFFDKASAQGTALIARIPLASGLLSGKFNQSTTFDNNDHRHYNANGNAFNVGETFSGIAFENGIELLEEIKRILPDGNLAQQSIKWILQHPAITTVIPGASKVEQVQSNIAAAKQPDLDEDTLQKLKRLYTGRIRQEIRGKY
ncbi:aldo/keto reductase [Sphingobacterium sp. DN00404]|uniref:Aldo/keto reductase n=1 Tax=Sphingobacterium micropteri TaxID=2763501 RepID=A0ABR7YL83_9SPHI|nr:aldo/keto reductase [Sphingobacterium micropteri]MBD1431991.1 aldo/keto reductase [Sphingobacterium micropteri]